MLSLDYRLTSGELELTLVVEAGVLWRYEVLHPSPGWKTLRVKLTPNYSDVTLTARLRGEGEAALRRPELRPLDVTRLPIRVWPDALAVGERAVSPSEAETERLRALGYVE